MSIYNAIALSVYILTAIISPKIAISDVHIFFFFLTAPMLLTDPLIGLKMFKTARNAVFYIETP